MTAQERIRQAALDAGWSIAFKQGERHSYAGGGYHDSDKYVIGSVDRHLLDGTPVTEAEHEIRVWYWQHGAREGQVRHASAVTFTVPQVIYRRGLNGTRGERDKTARIVAALTARTADIPTGIPAF